MYARVTKYKMKKDKIDAAAAMLETLKPQIMGMPGILNFINVIDDDGNGYVVSVVESEDISNANQGTVAKLWANFGDMLAAPPVPGGYNVLANEAN